ncbi:MAG TPA: chorismate synthase, partial [Sphingopyxis terrae]|nr:chorismate synthase [Sphingopyxis terrae]
ARLILPEVQIHAWVAEIGGDAIDPANFDLEEIDRNPFFCPDPAAAQRWEGLMHAARKAGSSLGAVIETPTPTVEDAQRGLIHHKHQQIPRSLGAVIECAASGVPAGWGAPIYAKLDADLASAMMGINAVKGVEIGAGFGAARLRGEENADPMRPASDGSNRPDFLSNNAGGIAGGISTGQPVVVRVAFKPTSSILTPVPTVNKAGEATDIVTKGRHDPCVGIRGVPVVEAMMALVLADHKLLQRAQCG